MCEIQVCGQISNQEEKSTNSKLQFANPTAPKPFNLHPNPKIQKYNVCFETKVQNN